MDFKSAVSAFERYRAELEAERKQSLALEECLPAIEKSLKSVGIENAEADSNGINYIFIKSPDFAKMKNKDGNDLAEIIRSDCADLARKRGYEISTSASGFEFGWEPFIAVNF
jgi:hypothetical protein